MLAGHDAKDFTLPKNWTENVLISIPPRGTSYLPVTFTSRFLRPAEAVLVLVGRRQSNNAGQRAGDGHGLSGSGGGTGATLVFTLRTLIDNISPRATVKCTSPCYEPQAVNVHITNPFASGGTFRIVLVEAAHGTDLPGQQNNPTTTIVGASKKKKPKSIRFVEEIESL